MSWYAAFRANLRRSAIALVWLTPVAVAAAIVAGVTGGGVLLAAGFPLVALVGAAAVRATWNPGGSDS